MALLLVVITCADDRVASGLTDLEAEAVLRTVLGHSFPSGSDPLERIKASLYRIVTAAYPMCLQVVKILAGKQEEVLVDKSAVSSASEPMDEKPLVEWLRDARIERRPYHYRDSLAYCFNAPAESFIVAVVPKSFYQRLAKDPSTPQHIPIDYPKPQAPQKVYFDVKSKLKSSPPAVSNSRYTDDINMARLQVSIIKEIRAMAGNRKDGETVAQEIVTSVSKALEKVVSDLRPPKPHVPRLSPSKALGDLQNQVSEVSANFTQISTLLSGLNQKLSSWS